MISDDKQQKGSLVDKEDVKTGRVSYIRLYKLMRVCIELLEIMRVCIRDVNEGMY